MTFRNVSLSIHDGVAVLRLASPSKAANALGLSVLKELREAATQARRTRAVKLLVLTGSGRSFSSGVDRAELQAADPEAIRALLGGGQALVRQILNFDLLTIAAINGVALGGGLELALSCDIRWAHQRAVLGLPEARLGLVPGWGGMSLLRRTVPESLWVEMVVGGECIGAHRAYDYGLVSRIFEGHDFEAKVVAAALKLADATEIVLETVKAELKRERAAIDPAAADGSFLSLWNGRRNGTPATRLDGTNTRAPR